MDKTMPKKRGNPNAAEDGKLGGRPKGSKNKISRDFTKRVLETAEKLEKAGKSLYVVAKEDPQWFYSNFYKLILQKELDSLGTSDPPEEQEPVDFVIKVVNGRRTRSEHTAS